MDKLRMQTANKADENFRRLSELFPNAVTETIDENGDVVRAIDKDVLMQEISIKVVDGKEERYQFTWPDKKKSVLLANAPINKTLRPCREESVDFDTTQNLYIEGDNLEVLKLLQETYLGKIKMIYIDPPYNTGNDFVYEDDFAQSTDEYLAKSGQYDDYGNRLVTNTESNGRFHTDWLNMIYTRLKIAKDLLSDDGVIFISIDDNELENLKKVCDEIFGEQNFATQFIWTKTATPPSLSHKCRKTVEYVLCYEKSLDNTRYFGSLLNGGDVPLLNTGNPVKELVFPIGSVRFNFIKNGTVRSGYYDKVELLDNIIVTDGINQNQFRMKAEFKWGQPMLNTEVANGTYFVCKTEKLSIRFQRPYDESNFKTPNNFLNLELNKEIGIGTNESAVKELEELGLSKFFDFPKPISLVKYLINMIAKFDKDAIILDFFSGSATTSHSVMKLNAEDNGTRKFIMVQLPEETEIASAAYKAGYKTICEIGKERIRRAGKKIKAEAGLTAQNLDIGFRVLKCDTSNMKEVFYKPDEVEQTLFDNYADNIKEDRTAEDLLFQVMLELGVTLSSSIKETEINGCKVFNVADGFLYACFDNNISDEVVKAIANEQPYYAVFRDSGMANDSVMTNFDQIFATYSPSTTRKVL